MKLSTIANAIGAQLHGPDIDFPSVSIDTRTLKAGECFIALKGENHDGHDYINAAIQKGAQVIVANRNPLDEKNISFLQVDDTLCALGKLGAFWRKNHPIPLVGVTGSCGKTTVKGMIESILTQAGNTFATKGNFNNHIGLPLMLLQLNASYQYAVVEMGASKSGEISYLSKIAQPNCALITNVMPAHLEGFGSVADVAKAKGEIYDSLSSEGIAILNRDEPFYDFWNSRKTGKSSLTFGLNTGTVYASDITFLPFEVAFTLHLPEGTYPVKIAIPGKHTVMNALAAACVGVAFKIDGKKIAAGLVSFLGVKGRLQRYLGFNHAWIIDDSYNANPGSVNAALEVLAKCEGSKIFVMGDMAELGEDAISYHVEVGKSARAKGIDQLFAVGKLSEHAVKAFGEGATLFSSKQILVETLKKQLTSKMHVLVKGSRSAGMEFITKALVENTLNSL